MMRDLIPSTTYATHGVYYYPARFIPQVVRYVLVRHGSGGGWVEDPFAGSGTTCVEALVAGRDCLAVDINPFTGFLVRLKTLRLPVDEGEAFREVGRVVDEAIGYGGVPFRPDWWRALYWYREDVYEELCRLWGYVHSLREGYLKLVLAAALLKVSRRFSYTDDQIPKLYRSRLKARRLGEVLAGNWRKELHRMLRKMAEKVLNAVVELNRIMAGREWPEIRTVVGVDASATDPPVRAGTVVTSPPYLIAHEYFRSTKLELYWLGYGEEDVRELAKKEIPYNDPPQIDVMSRKYTQYRERVASKKPRLLRYYDTYFRTVLAALQRHSPQGGGVMAVFIGPATLAGIPIPVHDIIREHFEAIGYDHLETLVDTITTRRMFRKRKNDNPGGITREYLLIMRAP